MFVDVELYARPQGATTARSVGSRPIAVPKPRLPKPLAGLDAIDPATLARLNAYWLAFSSLKGDTQRFLERFPTVPSPDDYRALARRVAALPTGPQLVRLGATDLALILKMALSVVGRNLGLAYAIAASDTFATRQAEFNKLLDTANDVTVAARRIVDNGQAAIATADAAQRAVGLGFAIADDVIEVLIAGGVFLIAVVLVVGLVRYIASAIEAYVAADRACQQDTAAGHPCSGTDFESYRRQAESNARDFGIVPNLCDAAPSLCASASGAVWLLAIAAIGYGAWVLWPAGQTTRAGLERKARARFAGAPEAKAWIKNARDLVDDAAKKLRYGSTGWSNAGWYDHRHYAREDLRLALTMLHYAKQEGASPRDIQRVKDAIYRVNDRIDK